MESLAQHLDKVRLPSPNEKIYKDECVYSFDTPSCETGLYVSLYSFLGFARDHVEKYFAKTGNAVFLHIIREKHEVPSPQQGDGPEKKITRLAIGVEGGFDPSAGKKYEYNDKYAIVVLPGFQTIDYPNTALPEKVSQCVTKVLEAPSATKLAEMEALTGTWDGEVRAVSRMSENLVQLDNGKKIPPSGWQCEKCDKTDNLWLNLTDGSILCGRKFHDGTGGNNHAVENYQRTGYPLAVKLGTITKEGKADVFSYPEDDMVEDPKLVEHLAHFGINIAHMEKTDKSMVELELDLNQRAGEWAALQENNAQLKPVYGPGYTGMANLGNSCYLNSVMQMLFNVPDFVRRFYDGANRYFDQFVPEPAGDFNVQMSKVAVGLLSGKYSHPPREPESSPTCINPHMLKTLIGRGHPDFSSKRQQDAQEFLAHVLNILERNSRHETDPSHCFKFRIEERVQCAASKKVKYTHRTDWMLPLAIPLEAAINKEEVTAYEQRKTEAEAQGIRLSPDALVRPRIKFFSCLEAFTQTETIEQFFSTALNAKTTARKTTRFSTFPDYLVIQLKKFTLREDWVPIKLDVSVEMPDTIDLALLRGGGVQPDEELLPELVGKPPPPPQFDEAVLSQLLDMGFPMEACKRALYYTHNAGIEPATSWLMEHIGDNDLSDPFVPPGTEATAAPGAAASVQPDPEALPIIMGMGFSREQAAKALIATDNNIERAADWIFSHQDELSVDAGVKPAEVKDGDTKYRLVAFISHMGTSTMVGHYVCHILREGRWVIYNDEKVALSENPPKDLAYIYLYERL